MSNCLENKHVPTAIIELQQLGSVYYAVRAEGLVGRNIRLILNLVSSGIFASQ
jgi:hypothetical protein